MNVAAILGVFNDFSNQTGTGRTKQGKIRAKVIKSSPTKLMFVKTSKEVAARHLLTDIQPITQIGIHENNAGKFYS